MDPDQIFQSAGNGNLVTSPFGRVRESGPHMGTDYAAEIGEPHRAPIDLRVVATIGPNDAGYGSNGNALYAVDGFGNAYVFLHYNQEPDWQPGDVIRQGETMGLGGSTGNSTGPHFHSEVITSYDQAAFDTQPPTFRSQGNHLDAEAMVGRSPAEFAYLSVGARNAFVTAAQEQLAAGGFLPAESVTGYYGEQTKAAVESLQRAAGMTGADVDGVLGSQTIAAARERGLWQDQGQTAPVDPAPEPAPPQPAPQTGAVGYDTPGAFAATSSADILSRSPGQGRIDLAEATLPQVRQIMRGIYGDNVIPELFSAIGARNGDELTFLRNVGVSLPGHEGQFSFGRENADPAAGFNTGTFQEGGSSITSQADSRAQFEQRVQRGVAVAERELGRELTSAELQNPAVRDGLAYVGWREQRSQEILPDLQAYARANPDSYVAERMAPFADTEFTGDRDQLWSILANPDLSDEQRIESAAFLSQGGVRAIGHTVLENETPGGKGYYVDMGVVGARGLEPDPLRSEPAFPTLSRGDAGPAVADLQAALLRLGHDLGATGPDGDGVDGSFGDGTRDAVMAAQRAAGFTGSDVDGVVGSQTWAVLARAVSQEVPLDGTGTPPVETPPVETPPVETPPVETPPVGTPPVGGPPVEAREPLGTESPEAYAVRQFDSVVGVGAWDDEAARVGMTGDEARWVADTERPGDPQVQLTFPGALDPAGAVVVGRPGSDVAAVLDAMAANGQDVLVRTSVQGGSTGTYVLVDEAAALTRFDSVDAFVEAARADLAVQQVPSPEARLDAAHDVLRAHPDQATYLEDVAKLTDALLAGTVGAERSSAATNALLDLARGTGDLTPAAVREAVAGAAPDAAPLGDGHASVLADVMSDVRTQDAQAPEVGRAFSTVREAEAAERSTTPSSDRDPMAPADRSDRTGTPGGDGQTVPGGDGQAVPPGPGRSSDPPILMA